MNTQPAQAHTHATAAAASLSVLPDGFSRVSAGASAAAAAKSIVRLVPVGADGPRSASSTAFCASTGSVMMPG